MKRRRIENTSNRVRIKVAIAYTLTVGLTAMNLWAGDSLRRNEAFFVVNGYDSQATVELAGSHSTQKITLPPGVKQLSVVEGGYIATISQPVYETIAFRIGSETSDGSTSASIKVLNVGQAATLVLQDKQGRVISYYWERMNVFTNVGRAFGERTSLSQWSGPLTVEVFRGDPVEVFEHLQKTSNLNWAMAFAEVRLISQPAAKSLLEAYVKAPRELDHVRRALQFLCYRAYDPKTGKEWHHAREDLCARLTADSSIWMESPVLPQLGIEAALAKKDYAGWKLTRVDGWPFAVFQSARSNGIVQSSLITADTKSKGWFNSVWSHVSELESLKKVQGKISTMRLDLRLQPSGAADLKAELEKLQDAAAAKGVELVYSDYP